MGFECLLFFHVGYSRNEGIGKGWQNDERSILKYAWKQRRRWKLDNGVGVRKDGSSYKASGGGVNSGEKMTRHFSQLQFGVKRESGKVMWKSIYIYIYIYIKKYIFHLKYI